MFILKTVVILSLLGLIASSPIRSLTENYGIVFDAGSSGTRIYIYKYDLTDYHLTNVPAHIEEVVYKKLKDDGIHNLKTEQDVEDLFGPAFDIAEELIPTELHSKTFVGLASTAGMRLLEATNPEECERIFNLIREYFQKQKFYFVNPKDQVKILSGTDEGIQEWLTVNYIFDKLKMPSSSYGLLRLGGSSAQIAFKPANVQANEKDSKYFVPLLLNNQKQQIYSYSYLCWGSNRAFEFYQTHSIKEALFKKKVSASCYPTGYSEDLQQIELKSACSNGFVLNNPCSFTIPESQWVSTQNHTFNGVSNNEKCIQDVATIVPKPLCKFQQCAFDGVFQPMAEEVTFLATGDFFDTIDNTEKLLKTEIGGDLKKIEELTDFICGTNYDELIRINKESGSGIKKIVHLVCFQNRYLLELLKAFGVKNVQFINKVDGYKIGWAMGYLMNEISENY